MAIGALVHPETLASVYRLGGMGSLDIMSAAFVDYSREELAAHFMEKSNEPYLLFIDSDQVFERKDAEMLIDAMEADKKIGVCAGLTVFRDGTYKPVVQWHSDGSLVSGAELVQKTIQHIRAGDVDEVQFTGTGFTMIRREAFADLERPYFRVFYDNDQNFWGEDVDFMESVRKAGWKTCVHFGTNVGHIGTEVYYPEKLLELEDVVQQRLAIAN